MRRRRGETSFFLDVQYALDYTVSVRRQAFRGGGDGGAADAERDHAERSGAPRGRQRITIPKVGGPTDNRQKQGNPNSPPTAEPRQSA